jgi:hypothetical protein
MKQDKEKSTVEHRFPKNHLFDLENWKKQISYEHEGQRTKLFDWL